MQQCHLYWKLGILSLATTLLFGSDQGWYLNSLLIAQEIPVYDVTPEKQRDRNFVELCQAATVRVVKDNSAGSGAIVNHEGNIYSVLTNWHVVDSSEPWILTVDNQQHQLIEPPQQLGNADLAILRFASDVEYPVATIDLAIPQIGDPVYAAGFPLMLEDGANSLNLGNQAFRLTEGQVSIIPEKSLPQGYRLGYTNPTENGMSGSPIFNAQGLLIGIHGRSKYRDPGFGVYLFEDGSEPSAEQLEQMIKSSWGIPIGLYWELK